MVGQHYVPKNYLLHFGDQDNQGCLREFDIKSPLGSSKIAYPSLICTVKEENRKHGYFFEIQLSQRENKAISVIRKINSSRENPTEDEREILNDFVALSLVRSKFFIEYLCLVVEKGGMPFSLVGEIAHNCLHKIIKDALSNKSVSVIEFELPLPISDSPSFMYSPTKNGSMVSEYVFLPLGRNTLLCYYDESKKSGIPNQREILSLAIKSAREKLFFNPKDEYIILDKIKEDLLGESNYEPTRLEEVCKFSLQTEEEIDKRTKEIEKKPEYRREENFVPFLELSKFTSSEFDNFPYIYNEKVAQFLKLVSDELELVGIPVTKITCLPGKSINRATFWAQWELMKIQLYVDFKRESFVVIGSNRSSAEIFGASNLANFIKRNVSLPYPILPSTEQVRSDPKE